MYKNITHYKKLSESVYNFPLTEEYMWARNQFFRSQFSCFTHHRHIGHFWKAVYKKLQVLQLERFSVLCYTVIQVQQKYFPSFL